MAPRDGFEPSTQRLTAACSTTELPGISGCRPLQRKGSAEPARGRGPWSSAGDIGDEGYKLQPGSRPGRAFAPWLHNGVAASRVASTSKIHTNDVVLMPFMCI